MNDFKNYVLSLNPVVFVAPVNGNHKTIDSYGRAVSEVGTTVWRKNRKGLGIDPNNSGVVKVANGPECEISTFTLFLATTKFAWKTSTVQQTLIEKFDGSGYQYALYRPLSNVLWFNDGAAVRTVSVDIDEYSSIALSCVSTQTAKLYLNGLFYSNFSGASTITTNTASTYIGARYNNTYHLEAPILTTIVFPGELTAQQILNIQNTWRRVEYGTGHIENVYWPVKKNISSPLVHLDFTPIQGNKLRDVSGNDLHFENEHVILEEDAPIGNAGISHNSLSIVRTSAYSASSRLDDLDPVSIVLLCKIFNPINGSKLFSKDVINLEFLQSGGDFYLCFDCDRAGGTAQWAYLIDSIADNSDAWMHVVVTYDRSNDSVNPILYINSIAQTWTTTSLKTGSFISDAAYNFTLLNHPSTANAIEGKVAEPVVYDKILTPIEVKRIYLEGALKPFKYVEKSRLHTTLSPLAAGARMGPYNCITAGHSVDEDSDGKRYLVTPTGSNVWESKFAYGSFYIKLQTAPSASDINIGIIQSINDVWSVSGNDGYVFRLVGEGNFRFYLLSNGTRTFKNSGGTCSSNTEYEIFISRNSSDSEFYFWVRGGIHTTWTNIFTFTDASYKTSVAMSSTAIIGTKIYDIVHFEGFLEPNDVPGLID